MTNLSQFILKKREEFEKEFPDLVNLPINGQSVWLENSYIEQVKSFLTQSHLELLEEVKRKLQSWLMNYDSKDGYSNLHDEILENLLDRLSKAINEVKK